jgi:signal peptidase I
MKLENGVKKRITGKWNEINNGKVVKEYTFKQNYYWMMGDNRHNSEDSRY